MILVTVVWSVALIPADNRKIEPLQSSWAHWESPATGGMVVPVVVLQPALVKIVEGDDWHFVSEIEPEPRSGLYGFHNNDLVVGRTPRISWADLQPAPDAFNWALVDRELDHGPVVIRLKCGSPPDVPAFLLGAHPHWKTFANANGDLELPQWSPGWLDGWASLIQALAARFKDNANLWGVQLQFTADGEPGMTGRDIEQFEALGFSPHVLHQFLTDYYRLTLDAFVGHEWKIFSTWKPNFIYGRYRGAYSKEAYARASYAGSEAAFARGLGIRGTGTAEDFDGVPDWPEWSEVKAGFVVTHDETFLPLVLHGHIDGQLENYYGDNKGRGTAVLTDDPRKLRYAIRMSLLRALSNQYSHLWLDGDDAAFVGADLVRWVRFELGRRPGRAPDAWVVLGQWGDIRAMPRWLQPLELDATKPGAAIDTSGLGFVSDRQWLGRAIRDLPLSVDDRFLEPGGRYDVQVVITYLDADASFHLEYDTVDGAQSAPTIHGDRTGHWKSATLQLPNATFAGRLHAGADLRLISDHGIPVVQMIRLIR